MEIPSGFKLHSGLGMPPEACFGDVEASYRREPAKSFRLFLPTGEDWAWAHREPRDLDVVAYKVTLPPPPATGENDE